MLFYSPKSIINPLDEKDFKNTEIEKPICYYCEAFLVGSASRKTGQNTSVTLYKEGSFFENQSLWPDVK